MALGKLKITKFSFFPGKSQLLLSEIAGVKPAFVNNVDIDSSGIIYISDSCRTWHMKEFLYPCLEGSGTGRCDLLSSSTCDRKHKFYIL